MARMMAVGIALATAAVALAAAAPLSVYHGQYSGVYVGDCYHAGVGIEFAPSVRLYADEC